MRKKEKKVKEREQTCHSQHRTELVLVPVLVLLDFVARRVVGPELVVVAALGSGAR